MADDFKKLLDSVRGNADRKRREADEIDGLLTGEHGEKIRRFFGAVKKAEGGQPDIIVGGQKRFDVKGDHPNIVGLTTKEGPSTAAGDYQITGTNWFGNRKKGFRGLKERLRANDFGPENQLRGALMLFKDRDGGKGLQALLDDDYDTAISIARKDWAALPGSDLHKGRNKRMSHGDFLRHATGKAPASFESLLTDVRRDQPPSEFDKLVQDARKPSPTNPVDVAPIDPQKAFEFQHGDPISDEMMADAERVGLESLNKPQNPIDVGIPAYSPAPDAPNVAGDPSPSAAPAAGDPSSGRAMLPGAPAANIQTPLQPESEEPEIGPEVEGEIAAQSQGTLGEPGEPMLDTLDPNAEIQRVHYSPNKPDNVLASDWMADDVATALAQRGVNYQATKDYLKQKGFKDLTSGEAIDGETLSRMYAEGNRWFSVTNKDLEELTVLSGLYNKFDEGFRQGLLPSQIYLELGREGYLDAAKAKEYATAEDQKEQALLVELQDETAAQYIGGRKPTEVDLRGITAARLGGAAMPQSNVPPAVINERIRNEATERFKKIIGEYKTPDNYRASQALAQAKMQALKDRREELYQMGVPQFTVPLQVVSNIAQSASQVVSDLVKYTDILQEVANMPTMSDIYRTLKTGEYQNTPAYQRTAYQAADAWQKWFETNSYNDELLNTNVLLNDVPKVLTQLAVQITAGAVTGGAAVPTLIGGAQGAAGAYDEAVKGGATPNQRRAIVAMASAAAVPEYFLTGGLLKSTGLVKEQVLDDFLNRTTRQLFTRFAAEVGEVEARDLTRSALSGMLSKIARGAGEYAKYGTAEAVQETVENKINNAVAAYTYDKTDTRWNKVAFLTVDDLKTMAVAGLSGGAGYGLGTALGRLKTPASTIQIDGKEFDTPTAARPVLQQALSQYETALETWEGAKKLFDDGRRQQTQDKRREYRQAARNAYERGVLEFNAAEEIYGEAQKLAADTLQTSPTGLQPMQMEQVLGQPDRRDAATDRRNVARATNAQPSLEYAPDLSIDEETPTISPQSAQMAENEVLPDAAAPAFQEPLASIPTPENTNSFDLSQEIDQPSAPSGEQLPTAPITAEEPKTSETPTRQQIAAMPADESPLKKGDRVITDEGEATVVRELGDEWVTIRRDGMPADSESGKPVGEVRRVPKSDVSTKPKKGDTKTARVDTVDTKAERGPIKAQGIELKEKKRALLNTYGGALTESEAQRFAEVDKTGLIETQEDRDQLAERNTLVEKIKDFHGEMFGGLRFAGNMDTGDTYDAETGQEVFGNFTRKKDADALAKTEDGIVVPYLNGKHKTGWLVVQHPDNAISNSRLKASMDSPEVKDVIAEVIQKAANPDVLNKVEKAARTITNRRGDSFVVHQTAQPKELAAAGNKLNSWLRQLPDKEHSVAQPVVKQIVDDIKSRIAELTETQMDTASFQTPKTFTHNGITVDVKPIEGLPDDLAAIQDKTIAEVMADPEPWFEKYRNHPPTKGGREINSDHFKELFDEYQLDPLSRVQAVHAASGVLADIYFQQELKKLPKGSNILYTAGGGGSGKGFVLKTAVADAADNAALIFDGVMRKPDGNAKLLNYALEAGHIPRVVAVFTDARVAAIQNVKRSVGSRRLVPKGPITEGHEGFRASFTGETLTFAEEANIPIQFFYNDGIQAPLEIDAEKFAEYVYSEDGRVAELIQEGAYGEIAEPTPDPRTGHTPAYDRRILRAFNAETIETIDTRGKGKIGQDVGKHQTDGGSRDEGAKRGNRTDAQSNRRRRSKRVSVESGTSADRPTGSSLVRNSLDKLRKKKEAEAPAQDEAFADLDELLGGTLKQVAEPVEQPFFQSKYDKYKPALTKAFDSISGETVQDRVDAFVDKLNERYTLEQLEQLEPYLVRFVDENVLPSGEIESIDGNEDDQRDDVQQDREDGKREPMPAGNLDAAPDLESGQPGESEAPGTVGQADTADGKSDAVIGRGSGSESGGVESTSRGPRDTADGGTPAARSNFRITNELDFERFSPKQRFRANIAAIKLLNEITEENRSATPEEQAVLAQYVGWGGLKQAFDKNNDKWAKEYAELRELLPDGEYEKARRSILNSHYTSKSVVQAVWKGLERMGFRNGGILEPSMGTGNFFGLMPAEFRDRSALTGVEMEPITSGIAKQLYPNAMIHGQKGFQDVYLPENSFDVAIGNPPFGDEKLFDKNNKDLSKLRIHAYFFAKSVNALRPGGMLGMVVSKGFMDSKAPEAVEARKYIFERANLVGAIRLPNTAFQDNANTEVTTDIIFLQKKGDGVKPVVTLSGSELGNVQDRETGEPISIHRYFAENPDMMLGEMTLKGKMYRAGEPTLSPRENQDIEADLAGAIAKLPENIYVNPTEEITERLSNAETKTLEDYNGIRPFNFGVAENGSVFQLRLDQNGIASELAVPLKEAQIPRVKGMIDLRGTIREILWLESNDTTTDEELAPLRAKLNEQYDKFQKKFGYISSDTNKRLMREDADYPLLQALEKDYDRGVSKERAAKEGVEAREASAGKADIFTKRTVSPVKPLTSVENADDALIASLNNRGRLDLGYMSQLYGKPEEAVIKELGSKVYDDPANGWVTADEYLSGDVKTKLEKAKEAADTESARFDRNVKALEKVIPADVEPVDIFVRLGSSWLPTDTYRLFAAETIGATMQGSYVPALGKFSGLRFFSQNQTLNTDTWGTKALPATKILEKLMTGGQPKVERVKLDDTGREVWVDGKPVMVVDQEQTAAAQGKAEALVEEFEDWIWRDRARREELKAIYNERFNRRVLRQYDGSHMQLPGLSRAMQLRPHIRNFVYRTLQSGKSLADHVVGAGKTPTAIATAMEMRRLGMSKKPMFTVPNHLVEQWALEFKKFYPGANILAATRKDFQKQNRRALFAKIATGDWDSVILAHSSFQFIPVPAEVEAEFIQEQIWTLNAAIDEVRRSEGKKSRSARDMEKALQRLEDKFKRLNAQSRDDLLNFSELGVDALFVDEAHEYKNLFFSTSKQGVGSLGDPEGSQKAFDMFMKTQMILRRNNDRNVVFLTGTPVSNSLAEIYHMQRYLQYETLKSMGILNFDSWANTFGQDVQDWELNAAGKFKQKLRFTKFANLPELKQLWNEVADTITNDDIKKAAEDAGEVFKIPKVNRHKVIAQPSPDQLRYIGQPKKVLDVDGNPAVDADGLPITEYAPGTIVYRMENWQDLQYMKPDGTMGDENVLRITNDARKAGLDYRLIEDRSRDFEGSKINLAVQNVFDKYKESEGDRGTQLVFLDLSTPKKRKKATVAAAPVEEDNIREATLEDQEFDINEFLAGQSSFSAYEDMRDKLIARGVPANQIAFIHDYETDLQKAELFGKMNRGDVRILFGSTKKMGAGTNVQKKLVALHNIDVPWKPSDLEQRNGRIIRQGNEFWTPDFTVDIYDYATERTYDARMWEIVEQKGTALDRFKTSDAREVEDVSPESANAAEMKASATGDPRILESITLKAEVKKLEAQKKIFDRGKFDLESRIAEFESGETREHIRAARFKEAMEIHEEESNQVDAIEFAGTTYQFDEIQGKDADEDKRKAANESIRKLFRQAMTYGTHVDVGNFRGFKLVTVPLFQGTAVDLQLRANGAPILESEYRGEDAFDPDFTGTMRRINNMYAQVPVKAKHAEADLAKKQAEYDTAKERKDAAFPKLAELNEKKDRSAELLRELRATTLKSVADSDTDKKTVEELQQMPYISMDDLLASDLSVDVTGSRIRANVASAELLRRTREEAGIRAKRFKRGGTDFEDMIRGEFYEPRAVQETVEILRGKAKEAKNLGYSPAEVMVFNDHASALENAAKNGDGTAIVFVLDSALPEEIFHQADYLNAADKSLLNRHTPDVAKRLDEHPIVATLWAKHFAKFGTYTRKMPDKTRKALLRAEIPPYLLGLTAKQLKDLGISPEQRTDYLLRWFEGYADKNGVNSLDAFEQEELDVQKFVEQVKEAFAKQQDAKAREKDENDTRKNPSGQQGEVRRGPPSDRGDNLGGLAAELGEGEKWASLPATLRRAGIEAADMAYEVFGDVAAFEEARQLINDNGIEGTLKILDNVGQLDVHHAMASFMIQRMLLDRAEQMQSSDPQEAEKMRQYAREVGRKHVLNSIAAGRFTRAASVIPTSVEGVMFAFHGLVNEYLKPNDKTLSPERWAEIEAMGRDLEEKDAKLQAVIKERTALKRQIKRLEDEKEGRKAARRTQGSDRRRKALVALVKKEKAPNINAARERLKARFSPTAAGSTLTLKSALEPDEVFPIDDFAEVGAYLLMEGIANEQPYLPEDFEAELVAEFGDGVRPYFNQIYRRSWELRDQWLAEIRKDAQADAIRQKFGEWLEDWEVEEILGERKDRAARRRAIENIHKLASKGRRQRSDIDQIAQLISNYDISENAAVAAIYFADNISRDLITRKLEEAGITGKNQREALREGELAYERAKRQIAAQKDAIANEILAGGKGLKQIDDLRWQARKDVQLSLQRISREMERIKNGENAYRFGQLVEASQVFRTMMASFDMSGSLRQGGFFSFAAPEQQAKAFANMFKSISEKGYGRAILEIERHANFGLAQRAGIDFAMAGKTEGNYDLMGEELFKGEQMIEKIPLLGKLVAEGIVKPSERTYTSFLDTQRMVMFDVFARELMDRGLTFARDKEEFKKIADFVNIATGRGTIPSAKFGKILVNLPLFAPRYTLSRLQLLNMTLNPVAYYRMPPAARKIIAKKAARFYGTTMGVLGLVSALGAYVGASVNWDPDDDDFMKITVGNAKYDIFAGLLPTAKLLIKGIHSGIRTKAGTDNRMEGEFGWDVGNSLMRFLRGKLSPLVSLGVDYWTERDYVGNKVTVDDGLGTAIAKRLMPLVVGEIYEAGKLDGAIGIAKSVPFTFFGVGVSTYKPRPERPETEAEKLAAKLAASNFSGSSKLEKEQRELRNELTARSRKGEDVYQEVDSAVDRGDLTDWHKRDILAAATKKLLIDKAEGLSLEQLERVFEAASGPEAQQLVPLMSRKAKDMDVEGKLKPDLRRRMEAIGVRPLGDIPMPDAVQIEFDLHGLRKPDVGDTLTPVKGGPKVKLNSDEYSTYREKVLTNAYQQIDELIKTDDYKNLPPEQQRRLIERMIDRARNSVQKEVKGNLRQPE